MAGMMVEGSGRVCGVVGLECGTGGKLPSSFFKGYLGPTMDNSQDC